LALSNVTITESIVEDASLAWLESLGYSVLHGPDIAAGEPAAERSDPNYRDVVLERRLREMVQTVVRGDLWFENAEKFVRIAR
jgi:type I restriction enzyme R subunit